jgi:dephospho-CoA kinase
MRAAKKIYKVGIIGGIGSGKSTVAKCFADFGISIIEADAVIRQLTAKNTVILKKISNYFGPDVLKKNGELDRCYLREVIFKNNIKKKWLEKLLHPLAYKELGRLANRVKSPYCILVIPLLVESPPSHKLLDRVLLVDSPKKLQIERAIKRDQSNITMIKAIIASQATNKQRLAIADDVIKNNKSIDWLKMRVDKLHKKYLTAASKKYKPLNGGKSPNGVDLLK